MKQKENSLITDENVFFRKCDIISKKLQKANNTLGNIQDGLYIHASAVLTSRGVILFLGHSTSGKSTISNMLSECYEKIEDDLVLLKKDNDGRWYVSERGKNNNNGWTHPLLSFIHINKALDIRLNRLAPILLGKKLLDSYFEHSDQYNAVRPKWNHLVFKELCSISKKNNGWELYFDLGSDIIDFFSNNINKL